METDTTKSSQRTDIVPLHSVNNKASSERMTQLILPINKNYTYG